MSAIDPFEETKLEAICNVLGDTQAGLTGSEIATLLQGCGIACAFGGSSKRRCLFESLRAQQRQDRCGNRVVAFIQAAMDPARYLGHAVLFSQRRDQLNRALAFSGLSLGVDGKLRPAKAARSLDEAEHAAAPPPSSALDVKPDDVRREQLGQELLGLEKLEPQERGYAFERFLKDLFDLYGLEAREPFRIVGQQIDGSFQLDGDTYLLEAKWQTSPVTDADLLLFQGRVTGNSAWGRGLFVSHNGFSKDGLEAFCRGRATSIVAMTGADLYFILEGRMALAEAIRLKARRAAESGRIQVDVYELALWRVGRESGGAG